MAKPHGNTGRKRPDLAARNRESATHGMTDSRTWRSWKGMRRRCNEPTNVAYHKYGGRGIGVCERWSSFALFLEDMGEAPAGMTLDRIDNDGDYSPENCRWATYREQANNRRDNAAVTYRGETHTYAEWSRRVGICRHTLRKRIHAGWTPERALTTPSRKGRSK
jgi:hypothetical protein